MTASLSLRQLVQLAKQLANYNAAEIRAIAHKRLREREEEDNLSERASELERLETVEREAYLPFDDLFYGSPETAQAFKHLCLVNPKIQPQYFLGILSPVSSLIGIKGSVSVPVLGKFSSTINISCVGESGEGKSIVSGILLDPLYSLQQQRRLLNQEEQKKYQQALENWEKQHPDVRGPKPRADEYITTSDAFLVINEYSREGIVKNHLDNPNGLLIHQEELVAIQRAQNMYRQGKGDDRQFLNNLYDNKSISRALKSERLMVEQTAVSIFGGYQPAILQTEMGDLSDPDGQWARFNFVTGIEKQVFTDLSQPTVDVSPLLLSLYSKALAAPEVECRLDKKGLNLLQKFVNEMEDLRWRTLQPGMRAVLSKAAGEVCRIALGLHWQNSLLVGDVVPEVIPALTVKKAIKIKRYFLRQMQLIRTWGDASPHREESLAPIYREVLKIATRVRGTAEVLTVRMVQQARSGLLKNLNAEGIKKLFKDLAAMGKATLVNWKRGIALSISSMFDGDDGQFKINPPRIPPSQGGESKVKNNSQSLVLNFPPPIQTPNPEPRTPNSSLLNNVGGLLGETESLNSLLDNSLTSLVGTVGTVGGSFSPTESLFVNLPTVSTPVSESQSPAPTSFNTQPTVSQQNGNVEASQEQVIEQPLDLQTSSEVSPTQLEAQSASAASPTDSDAQLTLQQLKAKLLACQTLTEIKALAKRHQEQVSQAYQELSPSQQLQVDGIAATAVPHTVYKYTGPTLETQGQKLSPGELLYIEPNVKVRSSDLHISVWLLEGLKCGWQQAVSVSRSCLILVEKAVTVVTEVIEGETGNLLDGLA